MALTEVEYYQQVATELQQGFANSLAAQAANYEGQLAMLKVQSKAEVDDLKAELEGLKSAPAPAEAPKK